MEVSAVLYVLLELLLALFSVLGNLLVCWAVCLNSSLQSITNLFVVSLAVADIAVGVLAIPFAIAISTGFCSCFYGCLFIVCFVLVLTQSSIFSLLAIAIDRYIAIKMPLRYNSLVTSARAKCLIGVCWLLSIVIGLTPMLGWHRPLNHDDDHPQHHDDDLHTDLQPTFDLDPEGLNGSCGNGLIRCLFEEVVRMDYMVYFNFLGCVLLPLLVMLQIYLVIFMAARRQLHCIRSLDKGQSLDRGSLDKRCHGDQQRCHGDQQRCHGDQQSCHGDQQRCHRDQQRCHGDQQRCHGDQQSCHGDQQRCHGDQQRCHGDQQSCRGDQRSHYTLQREVQVAKSLAIIVGLFAVCWLPLHIINCFTLFCPQCSHAPDWLMYVAIILSHANSVVNPFIYAYRIREFRQTFRRILRRHLLSWRRHQQLVSGGNSTRTCGSTRTRTSVCTPDHTCTG
ncbi:adenosine A2a receptor a [Engraulis encrasicolus]|uniref:adenosine A2a receptor a n=1 Tax=Engraulis encrasicolus TaxID=184585 RepID=UPI002FD178B4